jgi:phage shock protein A
MNLFKRALRGVKGKVETWLEAEENPELILDRAIAQMSQELVRLRQATASAIATSKRTERHYLHHQALAQEWYRRAQLACDRHDEATAKAALARRQGYLDTADRLQQQLSEQRQIGQQLRRTLLALEQKLSQTQTQQTLTTARLHSAQAAQCFSDFRQDTPRSTAGRALEQLESKIAELEAESELAAIVRDEPLDQQFVAMETATRLEADFAALQAQRQSHKAI